MTPTIDAMWEEINLASRSESREELAARIGILSDCYRDEGGEEFADYLKLMSQWPQTIPRGLMPYVQIIAPLRQEEGYPSDLTDTPDGFQTQAYSTCITSRVAVETMFKNRKVRGTVHAVEGGWENWMRSSPYRLMVRTPFPPVVSLITECEVLPPWSDKTGRENLWVRVFYSSQMYTREDLIDLGVIYDRPNDLYCLHGTAAEVKQKLMWLNIANRTGVKLWQDVNT